MVFVVQVYVYRTLLSLCLTMYGLIEKIDEWEDAELMLTQCLQISEYLYGTEGNESILCRLNISKLYVMFGGTTQYHQVHQM